MLITLPISEIGYMSHYFILTDFCFPVLDGCLLYFEDLGYIR